MGVLTRSNQVHGTLHQGIPAQGTLCHIYSIALGAALVALLFVPGGVLAEQLLGKPDVAKAFSTTFADWSDSLKDANEMGDAKVAVHGTYIWTKLTLTSLGVSKVTTEYLPNQLKRPNKLKVSLAENKARSSKTLSLKDEDLLDIIASFQKQMLPEYSVMTTIDLIGDVSQYHFTLYEVCQYPQMDKVAIQTKGCWQQCIRR